MRTGIVAMLAVGLLSGTMAMAQDVSNLTADEMPSVEWRDCAGHFYLLGNMLAAEAGENPPPDTKGTIDQMNMWGLVSIQAGEYKALAEADAGQTAPLGILLTNPESMAIEFDMLSNVTRHAAMAEAEGRGAYISRYAQKCGGPVSNFTVRLMAAIGK